MVWKDYVNPNDADNTCTWYDPNPATNGGDEGTPGDGTDTADFIADMNAANYGGYNDWRLPTIKELSFITNSQQTSGTISSQYFPNTQPQNYWSSSYSAGTPTASWVADFSGGFFYYAYKSDAKCVRAVRGGWGHVRGNIS